MYGYGYGIAAEKVSRTVAIYARVSTEHEEQLSALENQIEWYKPFVDAHPEWILKQQYVDEGITGTSAEKRPQFMQMMEDAKAGKFDLIITREVARFARNTVDTLQYTRMLKEIGVEVFFINDNIKTFDCDGELRLTLMATLAQDESRKTSIRVKSGQMISMKKGVFYGTGNILGYDRVGKDMVINPEQAKTVRKMFDMYLSGMGTQKIQFELERLGYKTATGMKIWKATAVARTLKNPFYCGIIQYHKYYVPDYLKQQLKVNHGAVEYIFVKGRHDPIVTEEEFNKVQEILASRRVTVPCSYGTRENGHKEFCTVWGRLMVCKCGKRFNCRRDIHQNGNIDMYFRCYTTTNIGSRRTRENKNLATDVVCDFPILPNWKLDMMAIKIFERYIGNADQVVELAYSIIQEHIEERKDVYELNSIIQEKEKEILECESKIQNLVELRADGDIDKAYFQKRKKEVEAKIHNLQEDIVSYQSKSVPQKEENTKERLELARKKLESYVAFEGRTVPENVVEAFIEKIFVSKEEFRWYLRSDKKNVPDEDRIKIGSFVIKSDEALDYLYSISKKRRLFSWFDLNVSVWI